MENYYDPSYDYAYASEPVWVGVKRGHERSEGKLDAAVTEKRFRCDDNDDGSEQPRWKHVVAYAPSAGAKRGYEESEEEIEAELLQKRYKCNYWEDPACAKLLEARGGSKAKFAAQLNQTYRLIKETDQYLLATLGRAAFDNLMRGDAACRNLMR